MDTIFFDLDGTLTDPKPGITRSIRYALQKLDHPTIPAEDELTWCIGPPLRSSFVKMLGEDSADRAEQRADPPGRAAESGGDATDNKRSGGDRCAGEPAARAANGSLQRLGAAEDHLGLPARPGAGELLQ